MHRYTVILGAAAALLGAVSMASAADAQQGKAMADQNCGACHGGMMGMWKGKSAGEIDGLIHQVVAGKVMHPKKLDLTDAQIADIAAYWASAANK